MNKVEALENEIRRLSRKELADLREWFSHFDGEAWDHQIEADAKGGKLEAMAARSLAAHKRGESREL